MKARDCNVSVLVRILEFDRVVTVPEPHGTGIDQGMGDGCDTAIVELETSTELDA